MALRLLILMAVWVFGTPPAGGEKLSWGLWQDKSSFNLRAEYLTQPAVWLELERPELAAAGCSWQASDRTNGLWQLYCFDAEVHNFWMRTHEENDQVFWVLGRAAGDKLSSVGWKSLDALGYGETVTAGERVWYAVGSTLEPSWRLILHREDQSKKVFISARDGHVLRVEDLGFDATGQVFAKNWQTSALEKAELIGLDNTGYLSGDAFRVFAEGVPRVNEASFEFLYDPNSDSLSFDQVQSYWSGTQILGWFEDRGYRFRGDPVEIHIHQSGDPDNAWYEPAGGGHPPKILLGAGVGGVIEGLARDVDVIAHEFSHHIVYEFLKEKSGNAGILHEGYADFFTYAFSKDPYLAESVLPGKDFLRTANITETVRIDDPRLNWPKHKMGQIWSAVLWSLRSRAPDKIDKLVYESIRFLGPDADYREAILALLHADKQLFPQEGDNPVTQSWGLFACDIFELSVQRGFATYIEDVDSSQCSIDLSEAAAESRNFAESRRKEADKDYPDARRLTIMGKPCSVIAGGSSSTSAFLFFIPVFVGFCLRRRRQ